MNDKIFITGITGMTGSLLTKKCLDMGLEVFGMVRPSSTPNYWRLKELGVEAHANLHIVEGDLTDYTSLERNIGSIRPDFIVNCAAQSHVKISFDHPLLTADITGLGVVRLLEAIRALKLEKKVKFITASSSEQFGGVAHARADGFLDESCRFEAHSPYAAAKIFAHNVVGNYRQSYGIFASTYIGFNHEHYLRGEAFVTRKITKAVANIALNRQKELRLGNIEAVRDWSNAEDIVDGIWRILNHHTADDFVLASGKAHSVREFLDIAFSHVGLDYRDYVVIDPNFYRPQEVSALLGDATKARTLLGWNPQRTFEQLVRDMVEWDLKRS